MSRSALALVSVLAVLAGAPAAVAKPPVTGVRVTSVEPGMAETEFTLVRTGGDQQASDKLYAGANPMTAEDHADLFWWLANLAPHLNINTIELMPVNQSWAGFAVHREG